MPAEAADQITKGTVMTSTRVSILLGAAIGLAVLAGQPATTLAADLDYGSVKDGYAPPAQSSRSWYLRSFAGFSNYESDDLSNELQDQFSSNINNDFESAPFMGFGLGMQANHWLRLEGTLEYRGNATFHGMDKYDNDVDPTQCDGADPTDCGTNEFTAVTEAWVGLASAYVDICTWRGITPFIGGSIGFANVDVKGMKDVNVPANSVATGSDNTETNFAWALHAGLSYEVTPTFTVDVGYRFMNLGDVSSGQMTTYDGAVSYASVNLDDLHSHDLLIGMRWKLDAPAAYPVAMK